MNCAGQLDDCNNDIDCIFFSICMDPCNDQACIDNCTVLHPGGAQLFGVLVDCIVCQECAVDCANTNVNDPFPGCP
jgi:hypothetical protein